MRKLLRFAPLILAASCLLGCGSSSIVTPPAGLGDEVRVPAELQATYDQVEALIQAQGLGVIIELLHTGTLAQRRALIYRYWDFDEQALSLQEIYKDQMIVHAFPETAGAEDSYAQGIADQLGAEMSSSFHNLSSQLYVFEWPADKTFGELAWIADWILKAHPDTIRFVDPNGPVEDD